MHDRLQLILHNGGFVTASIVPAMEGFLLSSNASSDGQAFEDPAQRVKSPF
jgi:hypothetical protein